MFIDAKNIHNISLHSSILGEVRPESISTTVLPDGRTEILVGSLGSNAQVRRISTDKPEEMEKHAARHMKIAANYLAVAELLKQCDSEQDAARAALLKEFGFTYPSEFHQYSVAIQKLVDNTLQMRKEAEEFNKKSKVKNKVELLRKALSQTPNGTYRAYNREIYGENPPESVIRKVVVANGRAYTFHSSMDITDKFYDGRSWVLLKD